MIQYITNEQHYKLLIDQVSKVKHTLWMGTADLKDLYIKKQHTAIPFLALLEQKVKQGVSIRLLHAKEPGEIFATTSINIPPYGKEWKGHYVLASISKLSFSIWSLHILVLLI